MTPTRPGGLAAESRQAKAQLGRCVQTGTTGPSPRPDLRLDCALSRLDVCKEVLDAATASLLVSRDNKPISTLAHKFC